MKKILLTTFLLLVCVCLWGQEVLWTRYYSDITEQECQEITGRTLAWTILQGKNSIYVKKIDVESKNPYLQLSQDIDGDYWFSIVGPYYTSSFFIGNEGYRPSDKGYITYDQYLITLLDPKYVGLNVNKYFKQP